jgi:hypothetical protein
MEMLSLPERPDAPEPFRPSQQRNAYRDLTLQDPPRSVTPSPIASLALLVPLLLLWVFYLTLVGILHHPRQSDPLQLLFLSAIPVLLAVAARFMIRALSHRSLLRSGCYSIGTVLAKQKPSLRTFGKSAIAYEFPVGAHKPMTGRGFDWSGKLTPGNPLLVFYDANDISRYVALCSTPWQVRTDKGEIFKS